MHIAIGNCLEKAVLHGRIEESRGPEQPEVRWIDNLVGQPLPDVCTLSEDGHRSHAIIDVTSCTAMTEPLPSKQIHH